MGKHIFPVKGFISKEHRLKLLGINRNYVLWLTGLPGSGKSTIAHLLEKELYSKGILSYVLDGDNIRSGLNSDLGFSKEDRKENLRRIAEVSKLFYDAGLFVIVSFISPLREQRSFARNLIGKDFIEVYVYCPLEICKKRDPKGLYKKAEKGLIKDFTGIDSPYEEPTNPEIIVDTSKLTPFECVRKILEYIKT